VRLKLGLGPVFEFECLAASRRWQYFAGRVVFIGLLLVALSLVMWSVENQANGPVRRNDMSNVGLEFYYAIIGTQLSLLFLIAPAIAADAICLDKARGALLPLLTTDLSATEIVLGKLFARFLPIVGFVFCGIPVLAICFSMGGIHPEVAFGAITVCLGVALVGGTAALVLSIWCTKSYEVLLVCYLLWVLYLLLLPFSFVPRAGWLLGWAKYGNPYYLCFAPYTDPGSVGIQEFANFFACCLGLSTILILFAIFRIRAVIVRHGSVVTKTKRRRRWRFRLPRLPGPSLDGNPVLWREWHRQKPSRWVRAVWIVYTLGALGFSVYSFSESVWGKDPFMRQIGVIANAFQVSIGLLLVSVTSVTSLQEERVRGSLDVLLTTPLSTLEVFWGKWWGNFRIVLLLTFLPTLVASGVFVRELFEGGSTTLFFGRARTFVLMPLLIICYGAAIVSLGLALGIWIKRPSRAMGASVFAYIALTVGLLFSSLLFASGSGPPFPALGSSFLGPAVLTIDCLEPWRPREAFVASLMAWCIIYVVGSAIISLTAYRSFDRCMGRMPEKMSGQLGAEQAGRRLLGRRRLREA
jgi:ABC-type transport system involved in multi-copper enzyme maturation permease subunit